MASYKTNNLLLATEQLKKSFNCPTALSPVKMENGRLADLSEPGEEVSLWELSGHRPAVGHDASVAVAEHIGVKKPLFRT